MHQQANVDDAQLILKGREVKHKVELLATKVRQHLRQKELPHLRHHDALVGKEARQTSLNTRHFRFADATFLQDFCHTL